jgi:predicted NBD/HSP70 family sugar kinase
MSIFSSDGFLEKLTRVELKKHYQKKKIVRSLYLHGNLSQSEIMNYIEVSAPTIQNLLDELINENIIIVSGSGSSKGGRRPNLYGLRRDALYILSIDIGLYVTRMTIFDSTNKKVTPVKKISIELKNDITIINTIYRNAQELIKKSGVNESRILGVGIDMPGLINPEEGVNHSVLNCKKPVKELFEEKFKKPVVIINDAKAKTLAEFRFGKAIGKHHVLVLHLGWGIGLGMILNGKPYNGANGFAGEFAHIPMTDQRGLLCKCGKRGCLETVTSGAALTRLAVEAIEKGEMTLIKEMSGNNVDNINPDLILKAASEGDQFAISIISKIGFDLGKGISSLVQILNPEIIILGGPLAKAGSFLTTSIEQALHQYTFSIIREGMEITISELGDEANLLGNTINVMEALFEN